MPDPTIAEARALLASAVGAVTGPGFTIRATPRVPKGSDRRAGDAWVTPPTVRPATFGLCEADFSVVVVLGDDPAQADARAEELSVPLVDAVTKILDLPVRAVTCTPESLLAGESVSGLLYVLVITATAEVS